jgi:hypothetical protein
VQLRLGRETLQPSEERLGWVGSGRGDVCNSWWATSGTISKKRKGSEEMARERINNKEESRARHIYVSFGGFPAR